MMGRGIMGALVSLLLTGSPAVAAKPLLKPIPSHAPVRVTSLAVKGLPDGYELQSDVPLLHEAYSMPQIQRFVIDMTNLAETLEITPPSPVAGVRRVMVQRKEINALPIRRLILDLASGYEGSALPSTDGKRLTITVMESPRTAPPPPPKRALEPVVPASPPPLSTMPPPPMPGTIIIVEDGIRIPTPKPVTPLAVFTLSTPPRLVVDLPPRAVTLPKETSIGRFGIRRLRFGSSPDKVRLVLDATGASVPPYRVVRRPDGIQITFTGRR